MEQRLKQRIESIKNKLMEKKVHLSPIIQIDEIHNFEMKYGVKLPDELVLFYTLISNGCKMIDGFDLYPFEEWKFDSEFIHNDFPFEEYWIWEDEEEAVDYDSIKNGVIELIDIGDAQAWNIVITGKKQGEMWLYSGVGIQPCAPAKSFLDWFEFWLDGNDDYFTEYC